MHQVTLEEAGPQLSRLIQEALQGEEVIITQESAPSVKLVPAKPHAQFGSAIGIVPFYMAEDFDAPMEEFAEYM